MVGYCSGEVVVSSKINPSPQGSMSDMAIFRQRARVAILLEERRSICLKHYNTPRLSGYFACSVLTNNSNSGIPRKFCKHRSFMKYGQHAKPVPTLRSSHSNAGCLRPVKARMHAIW
jgi:hypothetical protein